MQTDKYDEWRNRMKNKTTKLPFKHGYRRQRKADGHPSRRQFEIARRKTRHEREAREAERVRKEMEERDAKSK